MGIEQASFAIAAIISILCLVAWEPPEEDRVAKYTIGLVFVVPMFIALTFPFVRATLGAFGYPEGSTP